MSLTGLLVAPSLLAAPIENIDLNGYLSFEYEQHIDGDAGGDKHGSFDIDLFDLVLNIDLSNRLRVATDITWEHGTATENGLGNAAIEYTFAEYRLSNLLQLRAGKMFTNFGIYNEIHTAKPAIMSVKEPLSTNKNNKLGSEFRFYPRWNTGIALLGNDVTSKYELDYIIQLSNGDDTEANPYEEDANSAKAINGRLRVHLSNNVQAGLSFYNDKLNHYDSAGNVDGTTRITSFGSQLQYETSNGFGIEAEVVSGKVRTYQGVNINRYALTAMFYYQISLDITPYYRYEYLDPNKDITDDNGSVHILGMNIPIDNNMYLKIELDKFSTGLANSEYNGADFVELKSSISIGF